MNQLLGRDIEELSLLKMLSNLKKKKMSSPAKSKTTKKRKAAGNESSFSCEICSVVFTRKDDVSRHKRNKYK